MANTYASTEERHEDVGYEERIAHAFVNYQDDTINKYSYQQKLLSSANLKHKEKLLQSGFGEYFEDLINCVETNQTVLKEILKFNLSQFGEVEDPEIPNPLQRRTLRLDNYRVNDMLSAIGREWSHQGKSKREEMWSPILKELSQLIDTKSKTMSIAEMNEVSVKLCNISSQSSVVKLL